MNYGKRKASKKQKRITSKKNMHKKKLGVRLFKGFLLCIFVCCILAAIGGGFIIKHVIDNAPEITADSIKPQGYTSTALADDGTTTIAEFTGSGQCVEKRGLSGIGVAYDRSGLQIPATSFTADQFSVLLNLQ